MSEMLNKFKKIIRQLDPQKRENLSLDIAAITSALSRPEPAHVIAIRQCGDDVWGECKQYPREDWAYEVSNKDTVLGYWEWVVGQAQSDEVSLSTLKAPATARPRD